MTKVAVVQRAPVLLDRESCLARVVESVAEAASEGAELVVLPEAFVPGYPTWMWRLRPGGDLRLTGEIHQRVLANAVDLEADGLRVVRDAAKKHGVTVVLGIQEREGGYSRSTLYCSLVFIGADGEILNRHRKLMPTNPERMVWGQGDASGLKVVDTPCGRLGGLICWENYMPLARYALYAQGIEIYVAPTWDSGDGWNGTMQHIAREARCWVIGSGTAMKGSDVPDDFPSRAELYADPDEWVNPGDSVIVAPGGKIVAGPMHQEQGILYADIDRERVAAQRRSLDVAGHYGRPDLFQLTVDISAQPPITLDGSD
jgi:nitrilase